MCASHIVAQAWVDTFQNFHLAQVLTHHKEDFDHVSGRVRTTEIELAFISSSGTVVLQWCSFWSPGEGRSEPSSEIAPRDASREAALFLGASGDNLENLSLPHSFLMSCTLES